MGNKWTFKRDLTRDWLIGVKENSDIRASNILNRRSVTKEKLSEWLECLCFVLDILGAPYMQGAVERVELLSS